MKALRALSKLKGLLRQRLPEDANAVALVRALPPADDAPSDRRVVAVQQVEDAFGLGLFTAVTSAMRYGCATSEQPRVELVDVRSFQAGLQGGWWSFVVHTFGLGPIFSRQWRQAWAIVGSCTAYRSNALEPIGDLVDWVRAQRAWKRLRADPSAPAMIDGIDCRDLVIDSYLRFRPSPRFVAADAFVRYLLWQAHRDVRRARRYFRKSRPLAYLSTYSTYVQHGVPARVALDEGVPVYTFGSFQEFGKRLTREDVFHTRNPLAYRRDFAQLPGRVALLAQARQQLEHRLSGGIDSATSYMAASAYRTATDEVPDVRDAVIVFLHDFYDSPHVYSDLVFDDFWDWACFTIDTLREAGLKFWLKPHPNQVSLSGEVIDELGRRYPGLPIMPSAVTNRQLADAGAACAVTVYGTVAHEMAFLGVPSIACARHPHVAFDFCRTAHDRAGYAALLRQTLQLPFDAAEMREQAMQFYVMHNLSLAPADLAMREGFIALWKSHHSSPARTGAFVDAVTRLAKMDELRHFAAGLSSLPTRTTPRDHEHAAASNVAELRRAP